MILRIQSSTAALFVVAFGLTLVPKVHAQDDAGRVKVQMPNVRAVSGYLKVGDIKGESTDADHKDWIDVLSVDWGQVDPAAPSRAPGQVVISRNMDKASPRILEAIANGKHIPAMELDAPPERADAGRRQYLRYELENVRITSYNVDASGDVPTETITLNFEKISQHADIQLKGKKILEN